MGNKTFDEGLADLKKLLGPSNRFVEEDETTSHKAKALPKRALLVPWICRLLNRISVFNKRDASHLCRLQELC
jgi:hypothetical protein